MAKTESKTTKKSKRRLKRSVRKTLGTLFLVSAIVVAAIPVDGLQAWTGNKAEGTTAGRGTKVWIEDSGTATGPNAEYVIPTVPTTGQDSVVYYSEDSAFQFALYKSNSTVTTPDGAIVLNFNTGSATGLEAIKTGNLLVPDTLDVYRLYNGFPCAWGNRGYLYYKTNDQYTKVVEGAGGTPVTLYGYMVLDPNKSGDLAKRPPELSSVGEIIGTGVEEQWVYYTTERDATAYKYTKTTTTESGNEATREEIVYPLKKYEGIVYKPCLAGDKEIWVSKEKGAEGLYYDGNYSASSTGPVPTTKQSYQKVTETIGTRYVNIPVTYIGNQVTTYDEDTHEYTVTSDCITTAANGIFSREKKGSIGTSASITSITFGNNLTGIGDYAFYGSSIRNVKFNSNSISVIGDYAFAECASLSEINFKDDGLLAIGAHAFENCVNLHQFKAPYTLQVIGDSAFEGCSALNSIALGERLRRLGYFVFKDCSSLTSLTFPKTLKEALPISTIEACRSLQYVKHDMPETELGSDNAFTFVNDAAIETNGTNATYTLEQFRKDLLAVGNTDFYFEGPENSTNGSAETALHKMARNNQFAFRFYEKNIYEITSISYNADDTEMKNPYMATYQAEYNGGVSPDTLLFVSIDPGMENVTIPGAIGPCRVTLIGANSFQNNCNLKSVTIPSSIVQIEAGAFKGCHNLRTVTFEYDQNNPDRPLTIGSGAFATQDVSNRHTSCTLDKMPQLFFEGPISPGFEAFKYAMNPGNTIDFNGQTGPAYITYFSGWPSNLAVRYNANTKKQELVAYPTIANIESNKTGLVTKDKDGKDVEIKWTDLNYIKTVPSYAEIFNPSSSSGVGNIRAAFNAYLDGSNNDVTGSQRVLIANVLGLNLPEGIDGVAWFSAKSLGNSADSGISLASSDDSGVIGIPAAEKISLFTLNERAEMALSIPRLRGSKTVITNGMEIADRTFEDCDTIKTAYIQGNTPSLGDYAFMGCDELSEVEIPTAMSRMGKRPFAGCRKLGFISCPSSEYFTCKNSILFGPAADGSITRVIECLEGRSASSIRGEDLAGATEMADEAFAGTDVTSVDFRETTIQEIPEGALQYTKRLITVQLPYDLERIDKNAFSDSAIENLDFIGDNLRNIDSDAFGNTVGGDYAQMTDISKLHIAAQKGSEAEKYAKSKNIPFTEIEEVSYYTVEFYGDDMTTLVYSEPHVRNGTSIDVEKLMAEGKINLPAQPGKKITWMPPNYDPVVGKPGETTIKIYAQYVVDEGIKYKVTFVDDDFSVVDTQLVSPSDRVSIPYMKPKNGVPFSGWVCVGEPKYNVEELAKSAESLANDVTFMAAYGEISGFTVTFQDWDGSILWAKPGVQAGESVSYPVDTLGTPRRQGYIFKSWSGDTSNITGNVTVFAIYDPSPDNPDNPDKGFTVTFQDWDGSVLWAKDGVKAGESVAYPTDRFGTPRRQGYTFKSWSADTSNITGNLTVFAIYEPNANPDNPNNKDDDKDYYTLTVRNGSGSGSYVAGSQAIIVANDPPAGQEFKNWTIEPTDTKIASTGISATVITMPEKNVTVVANYQAKSGVNNGNGNTVSGNSPNTPGTTNTVNKGGTTVVINKNGLSNTGVVSATVNGSSDNFTVKVSESGTASEAVVKALMAEYANDLSNISYFPMDISLYDATGQKKITDTTGLKITITLPLPDSLKDYAGNNKVAGVVNDRLDKLTPKFTTISGVPCITFTAEHFSPYVIYVDTRNLSANGMVDSTPKTGDGIHPKWFLSSGLGCLSIVFFMKKDKKKEKKKVKAKA